MLLPELLAQRQQVAARHLERWLQTELLERFGTASEVFLQDIWASIDTEAGCGVIFPKRYQAFHEAAYEENLRTMDLDHTAAMLFNVDDLVRGRDAVMVEGAGDVMGWHQRQTEPVAFALLGVALTPTEARVTPPIEHPAVAAVHIALAIATGDAKA